MPTHQQFAFAKFRFESRTGQLWCDGGEIKLTPRVAAVLHLLAERAEELVTKQDLIDRVWGGMVVGDDALTSCIQELRSVLGDNARQPRYIETRHRRGYRLMVPATVGQQSDTAAPLQVASPAPARLAGRVAEFVKLAHAFDQMQSGRRQIVFISGEPGIGKSSLADAFLEQLRSSLTIKSAYGQCLDHHGVGEPYLPLIEALTRLASGPDSAAVKEILSAQAPSWLAQMPALWTRAERNALETRGRSTRERMMRELTLAIEAIASDVPLVLKLEDIHWSDTSTLDWLAHLARRPEPARLMVVATFRPADAAAAKAGIGNLVTELALHGQCTEIELAPLGLEAIESYLAARLGDGGAAKMREMASILLERTGGNPLFMTSIVNQLAQQESSHRTSDVIVAIPHDVRRFIDRQIDELTESDRHLLTAASVIRREFATLAVAAALQIDVDQVEIACARLARQGVFVVKSGSMTWPDGTPAELYVFRHDLYRELLYDRLPATRRALCHARVGRRLEAAWAGRLDAIASELAEHFERGNEPVRAIPHHQRAADKAMRRGANEEAIGHLQRALGAVGHIAGDVERTRVEVGLLVALGAAFFATRGFGAPEVLEVYARAEALCEGLGERPDIFPALWGQWLFRWGRSELDGAWRLCERLLTLAEKSDDAGLKLQAHHASWATALGRGKLAEVRSHAVAGLAIYDSRIHQAMASSYGNHDAACCARNFSAISLALAGDDQSARAMIDLSVSAAKSLGDPFTLALTLYFTSAAAQMLGDIALATANSALSMQMATEHDLAQPKAWSMGVAGWCIAENGDLDRGLVLATQGIATLRAIQSRHFSAYLFGLLADIHLKAEHPVEAMKFVEEGLAMAERFYSAELHRLHGELLARPPHGEIRKAEASFRTSIRIATEQGAKTLERKAVESLRRWSK